jgi:hypothetical protein
MSASSYLGGYWGPRAEFLDECTERMIEFMKILKNIDPELSTWCEPGESRREAVEAPVYDDHGSIRDLFFAGRYQKSESGAVFEDLGFSISLWNGRDSEVGLSAKCGGWSPGGSNNVLIDLPQVEDACGTLYVPATGLALMRATVNTWAPDYATWTSYALHQAQGAAIGEVAVGWATYVSASRLAKAAGSLPASVRTEPLGDGLLIVIGDDPTSVPLALVMDVRAALGQALLPEW